MGAFEEGTDEMRTELSEQESKDLAQARADLAEKLRTSTTVGSFPELDRVFLRLHLPDDSQVSFVAQEASGVDSVDNLQAGVDSHGQCTADGSTYSEVFENADDQMRFALNFLESVSATGMASASTIMMMLAELRVLREDMASQHERTLALQKEQVELLRSFLGAPALAMGGRADAEDEAQLSDGGFSVHRGVELGEKVMLDEDVYAESPAHVPPKVYVFDEYDSEALAESNCTLVDAASGDWTVRGIGELVPVDEDAAADDEGTEER